MSSLWAALSVAMSGIGGQRTFSMVQSSRLMHSKRAAVAQDIGERRKGGRGLPCQRVGRCIKAGALGTVLRTDYSNLAGIKNFLLASTTSSTKALRLSAPLLDTSMTVVAS